MSRVRALYFFTAAIDHTNKMKRHILTILTLAAALLLPTACSSTKEAAALAKVSTTAQTVVSIATAVPATVKQDLASLTAKFVAAHPGGAKYLDTIANAIESVAYVDAKLPDPNGTFFKLVSSFAGGISEVGSYVTDVSEFYGVAYPFLKSGGATLTELGELIRSFDGAPVATATPQP